MDRIEKVREYVDSVLIQMPDAIVRRHVYVHLYGVSQACTLIALKRGENAELATIAGKKHLHPYLFDGMVNIINIQTPKINLQHSLQNDLLILQPIFERKFDAIFYTFFPRKEFLKYGILHCILTRVSMADAGTA